MAECKLQNGRNPDCLKPLLYSKKGVYLDTPKSGRIRVVYASDDTMALLRQLRMEQAKKAVSAFVFTKEGSPEPMHPQSPTRYLKNSPNAAVYLICIRTSCATPLPALLLPTVLM